MLDLGGLPGFRFSEAIRNNDVGEIVGVSNDSGGDDHPVIWTVPPTGSEAAAAGIIINLIQPPPLQPEHLATAERPETLSSSRSVHSLPEQA